MLSIRINRWTIAALSLALLAAPSALLAQTPDHTGDNTAQFPSNSDLKSRSIRYRPLFQGTRLYQQP